MIGTLFMRTMYEPEKILVQNAGIDPGVAALLQNANKGNMDPAALMAMMNNGGFGGNGGWWWIWIILIFFCWGGFGGNGFGRGSDDASRLASQLNTDTNTSLLMQAIQGNKDAISSLSNTLSCDINAVQTALNTINTSVSQIACDTNKKTTVYSLGSITQVSNPYDEALPQGQFPIPGQSRRKLVDVFISCNGESKKLSVPAERSIINDTSIGLTVATNKEEIANMVRQNYNEFKAKKEAASKYDEEMEKCKDILDQLEAQVEAPIITNTIDNSKEINDLKNDVADIRKMIEDTKKMFMGGFSKPPMPPMPNLPAPMK